MSAFRIGLQLYTVRDELDKDFVGTLRKVAEMGFEGVEFAGYGGLDAETLRSLLDELQLAAVGSHVSLDRLRSHLDEEIAFNQTIGNRYIVCPYLTGEQRQDERAWQEVYRVLREAGQKCAESGLVLCYHNHDFELTQEIAGRRALDALFAEVPAELLQVELDACWVYAAGFDPVQYLLDYAGRLPLLHFKDMKRLENGDALTVELGQGEVPLRAILTAASVSHVGVEWLIIEQDVCQNPSLASAANSLDWLRKRLVK